MAKVPQPETDLRDHLEEQLGFLRRSSEAYDGGYTDEAKRLAVTIRVLVHDTATSKSLLGQLGEKGRLFWDTAVPNEVGNLLPYGALIQMAVSNESASWYPYLDDPLPADAKPAGVEFSRWWQRMIFLNMEKQGLSRKDLVLAVANQDGGAHVDPELNGVYAELSRKNGMGWTYSNEHNHYLVRPPELAAVRQIAHEILKTFDPSLEVHPKMPDGSVVMGTSILRLATPEEIANIESNGADRPPNSR